MNTYELENIAEQKGNSFRDEGAAERYSQETSSLPRVIGFTLAILTFIGWVAQYL